MCKFFLFIFLIFTLGCLGNAQDVTTHKNASVFQDVMLSNMDSVSTVFLEQLELTKEQVSDDLLIVIESGGDLQCLHFTNRNELMCTGIRYSYAGFNYGTLVRASLAANRFEITQIQDVSGHMLPSDWEYLYDDPSDKPQMVAMHVQTRENQGETEFYIIVQSADGTSYPFSFGLHDELPILLIEP